MPVNTTVKQQPKAADKKKKTTKKPDKRPGLSKFLKEMGDKEVKNPNRDSTYDKIKVRSLQKTEEGNKVLDEMFEEWKTKNDYKAGDEDKPKSKRKKKDEPASTDEGDQPEPESEDAPVEDSVDTEEEIVKEESKPKKVKKHPLAKHVSLLDDEQFKALSEQSAAAMADSDFFGSSGKVPKDSKELPSKLRKKYPSLPKKVKTYGHLRQLVQDLPELHKQAQTPDLPPEHVEAISNAADDIKNLPEDEQAKVAGSVRDDVEGIFDGAHEANSHKIVKHLGSIKKTLKSKLSPESYSKMEKVLESHAAQIGAIYVKHDKPETPDGEQPKVDESKTPDQEADEPEPSDEPAAVSEEPEEVEEEDESKAKGKKKKTRDESDEEDDEEDDAPRRKTTRRNDDDDDDDEKTPLDWLGTLFYHLFKFIGTPVAAATRGIARAFRHYSDNHSNDSDSSDEFDSYIQRNREAQKQLSADQGVVHTILKRSSTHYQKCGACEVLEDYARMAKDFKSQGNLVAHDAMITSIVTAAYEMTAGNPLSDLKITADDMDSLDGPAELSIMYSKCLTTKGNRNYCARLAAETFLSVYGEHPFAQALSIKVGSSEVVINTDSPDSYANVGDEFYILSPGGTIKYGPIVKVTSSYIIALGQVIDKFTLHSLFKRRLASIGSPTRLRPVESKSDVVLLGKVLDAHSRASFKNTMFLSASAASGSKSSMDFLREVVIARKQMENKSDRVVIWIPLSDRAESVVDALQKKAGRLADRQNVYIKETPKSAAHITLLYVGDKIPPDKIPLLRQVVENVVSNVTPKSITASEIGYFHNDDASVCKIDVPAAPWLDKLHWRVRIGLEDMGLNYDHSYPEYQPHITLHYLEAGSTINDLDFSPVSWVPEKVCISHGAGTDEIPFKNGTPVYAFYDEDALIQDFVSTADMLGIGNRKRPNRNEWNKLFKHGKQPKKWKCCSKPTKDQDRNHKNIWVSNCRYKTTAGARVMKRIVGRGGRQPKVVTLNGKRVPWCTGI